MAGSHGALGRLHDVARVLRDLRRPLQGLVVAGHDARLRAALARLTDGTPIRTLGYVEDVRRLMAAADLLVTKAGDDARRGDGGRHAAPPLRLAARPGAAQRALRGAGIDRARRAQARAGRRSSSTRSASPICSSTCAHGCDTSGGRTRPGASSRPCSRAACARDSRAAGGRGRRGLGRVHLGRSPRTPSPSVGPGFVRRGPATGRRIALTFDDGLDPYWTSRVLEVLGARSARATFFLVGERARAPETVRPIATADHEVASHGWSHRSLWLCGPRRTDAEIARAQRSPTSRDSRAAFVRRGAW